MFIFFNICCYKIYKQITYKINVKRRTQKNNLLCSCNLCTMYSNKIYLNKIYIINIQLIMSYRANPQEDEQIRMRIREILNEKIKDRTYKGEGRQRKNKYRRKQTNDDYNYRRGIMEGMAYVGGAKNPKRKKAGKKASKKNPWTIFLIGYIDEEGGGRSAVSRASHEYKIIKNKWIIFLKKYLKNKKRTNKTFISAYKTFVR